MSTRKVLAVMTLWLDLYSVAFVSVVWRQLLGLRLRAVVVLTVLDSLMTVRV